MANSRPPRLSQSSLLDAAPPPPAQGRRWLAIAGVIVLAALLALAWFDGGEEPLRPIAQDVAVPEAPR